MADSNKTRQKLVETMRKSKDSDGKSTAEGKKAGSVAARKQSATRGSRRAQKSGKNQSGKTPVTGDPYQNIPRVWPD